MRSLSSFEARWGALPPTLEAHTGGGGRHLWFSSDEALSSAVLAPGLELKAERAVVVAPPSIHASGRPYVWAPGRSPDDVAPAPVPGWVEALAHGDAHADLRHPLADPPVRTTQERAEFAEAVGTRGSRAGARRPLLPLPVPRRPSPVAPRRQRDLPLVLLRVSARRRHRPASQTPRRSTPAGVAGAASRARRQGAAGDGARVAKRSRSSASRSIRMRFSLSRVDRVPTAASSSTRLPSLLPIPTTWRRSPC